MDKRLLLPFLAFVLFTSSSPIQFFDSTKGNQVAFSILKALSEKTKNTNFVFSPYGIRNCFAYVYAGAANKTKDEMETILKFNLMLHLKKN